MYTTQLTLSDFEHLRFKKCWLLRIIWFHITSIVYTCPIPFHTQRIFSPSTSLYNGTVMFSWRQEISTVHYVLVWHKHERYTAGRAPVRLSMLYA